LRAKNTDVRSPSFHAAGACGAGQRAADLLRDVLQAHAQAGTRSAMSGPVDSPTRLILSRLAAGPLSGSQTDIALAARLRILSLACLVRDHVVDDWIKRDDASGIVLFHRSLFLAAAAEPLILLPRDDIGFDSARFRRRVLELTAVQGSA
jgi:hypothetical protein